MTFHSLFRDNQSMTDFGDIGYAAPLPRL